MFFFNSNNSFLKFINDNDNDNNNIHHIILIIILNLPNQSFYWDIFLKKKLLTIIIMIILIIYFFHFSSMQGLPIHPRGPLNQRVVSTDLDCRGCTQRKGLQAKLSGLQTLPRWCADPRVAALQTLLPQGCSQVRSGSAPSAQGWEDQVLGGCNLGLGQARLACPTPCPGSPSVRCPQPQGSCLKLDSWCLQ